MNAAPTSCLSRRGFRPPATERSRFALAGLFIAPILVLACGPFFPNSLLSSGDEAVLQAPTVSFAKELARLQLEPPPRLPIPPRPATPPAAADAAEPPPVRSDREVTVDAEMLDLRRALAGRRMASNAIAAAVLEYSRSRADLEEFRHTLSTWEAPPSPWLRIEPADAATATTNRAPRPELRLTDPPATVPREFELYLRGAARWHEQQTNEARQFWTRLLALPVAERPFKSTWAAYMLGRSWHDTDPARATAFYEQTRALARSGFADSAGLAVASLGRQAQLRLRTNDLAGTLRLYLDQYSAGDSGAVQSLTYAARKVVEAAPEQRLGIARDPLLRRVVTAWVLSTWTWDWSDTPETTPATNTPARAWLASVEAAGASEVALAEQLAVLAYQAGDWSAAQRWVDLSGDSVIAGWIHAKLLLRAGKLAESTEELARVVARLPLDPPPPVRGEAPAFADSLSDLHEHRPAANEALGELGVLRITRGEFVQALDALLRAGFWQDAAYVAERVLTVDELKRYVDGSWPRLTGAAAQAEAKQEDLDATRRGQRERIRHLLARRLNRVRRGPEAIGYFPDATRAVQERFLELLRQGANRELAARDRARAWFLAGGLTRTNGLELLGTATAPDWAIWDGNFEEGPTVEVRRDAKNARVLRPTSTELKRAAASRPQPDLRFHYRYAAATLAWEAAKLLPDNDPETALILWTGGSWLKHRDPQTADRFYKALVRRCRRTELGDAADRQRWFPDLDVQGKPVVTRGTEAAQTK